MFPRFATVSLGSAGAVTRKSLVLFAAASVIWGSSFLFIRVAVEHIPPAVVVFGRTVLGAAFLVPLQVPPASSIVALTTLGIVNTGVAYWLFHLLIDGAGAATASVITYVMPVVALFLGVGLLGERLTAGAIAGLILIALGAWLATSLHTPGEVLASVPRRRARPRGLSPGRTSRPSRDGRLASTRETPDGRR